MPAAPRRLSQSEVTAAWSACELARPLVEASLERLHEIGDLGRRRPLRHGCVLALDLRLDHLAERVRVSVAIFGGIPVAAQRVDELPRQLHLRLAPALTG